MKIVLLESLGISQEILSGFARQLEKQGHQFVSYEKNTDEQVQIERAQDADILIIANMPLSGRVIRACKQLRFIDVAFTGVDHVDLEAAKEMGIKVSNAAGYSTQAVAELAVCMMLSLLRNLSAVEQRCRNGQTKDGLVGCELGSRTVGIVGAGAIGCRTAALCHAFGAKVLGYKRHVTGEEPDFIRFVPLEQLLQESDIVSLHCPINEQSRNLINRDTIARMKQGAMLINTHADRWSIRRRWQMRSTAVIWQVRQSTFLKPSRRWTPHTRCCTARTHW